MRVLVFILLLAAAVLAQLPWPAGFVSDFAGVIDENSEYSISQNIAALEKETGAEIAVVTINALPAGETMQTYANKLLNEWGVGKEGEDNGLLVLVSVQDRRIQVETGYGLEGILPDGKVGRILDNHVEDLGAGNYGVALEGIASELGEVIRNEYVPGAKPQSFAISILPYAVIFFIAMLFIIAVAYNKFAGKCPKCNSRLRKQTVSKTSKEMKIKIFCLQCGYVKYVTKKTHYGMIVAGSGGGGRSGGFGGFGGGGSGGGGAGRGF